MKSLITELDDLSLLTLMKEGHVTAFEAIYNRYAKPLLRYGYSRIGDKEDCEELVQEIFIKLWERRGNLEHVTALKSYLYSALRYRIANYIAHSRIRIKYAEHYEAFEASYDNNTEQLTDIADFDDLLERSLASLPDNCRTAFKLSRMEHLTIPEIAQRMNLNPRTIENYITQALKHLRTVWKR